MVIHSHITTCHSFSFIEVMPWTLSVNSVLSDSRQTSSGRACTISTLLFSFAVPVISVQSMISWGRDRNETDRQFLHQGPTHGSCKPISIENTPENPYLVERKGKGKEECIKMIAPRLFVEHQGKRRWEFFRVSRVRRHSPELQSSQLSLLWQVHREPFALSVGSFPTLALINSCSDVFHYTATRTSTVLNF